jgi:hypothetical protein
LCSAILVGCQLLACFLRCKISCLMLSVLHAAGL